MQTPLCALLVCLSLAPALLAAADPAGAARERTAATCLLALGRSATADELAAVAQQPARAVSDQLAGFRAELSRDPAAQKSVAERAWQDAFGKPAQPAELVETAPTALYSEALTRHTRWLATHPDAYRAVIDRAYRLVVGRPAYDLEFEYWSHYEPLPYVLLVGCVEGWARRNAPGLMATTGNPCLGVNSAWVTTLSVSPAVADELRAAFGLEPSGDAALARAAGHNVVAPGADQIASLGGMFVVVVGNSELARE